MSHPTYAAAAKAAGISLTTVYRYLRLPCVQRRLAEAKGRIVDQAVNRLSALSVDAVNTLHRNLCCGNHGAENRAASSLLDNLRQMQCHRDLEERLTALEDELAAAKAKGGR